MKFATNFIQKIVKEKYGFECGVKPLAGDVDFNFLLELKDNSKYLLKISKPEVTEEEIQFQIALLNFLKEKNLSFEVPLVISTVNNQYSFSIQLNEVNYAVRLHSWVEGRMLSELNPRTTKIFHSWGEKCGELSDVLQGFDHSGAHRFDKWNPIESLYSKRYLKYIKNPDHVKIAEYFWDLFEELALPFLPKLRRSVNYSDAHENNLVIDHDPMNHQITGVIDFGDAIYAPTICELAIACAYAGMYVPDPVTAMCEIVKGYNAMFEVEEIELEALFPLICGRLMITVANAAHNLFIMPDSEYHQISAKPAWALLKKLKEVAPQFAHFSFRSACNKMPHPKAEMFQKWMTLNMTHLCTPVEINARKVIPLDLSVGSLDLGNNSNFDSVPRFTQKINSLLNAQKADVGIGGYAEIRPFYTTDAYKVEGNYGPQWRTMHLGMDYWTDAETAVLSIWDGEVHAIHNNDNPCDYGPTIILKHNCDGEFYFYSLYGHLSAKSLIHLELGQKVKQGDVIGWIGQETENGGWPPHLHYQIMLDLMGYEGDFPGVAFVTESEVWLSNSPSLPSYDRFFEFKSDDDTAGILDKRKTVLGKSLSVSYQKPLHLVRGFGAFLYDVDARRYIDMVNNVAHVGHEHPRVVRAAQKQMELLNTNTRYLHENIVKYAESILSRCPSEMDVVYFVNSGSEANELALRMAKTYSLQQDVIALESGYHGNTGACVDVSSYKFDGKGGAGAPEFTTICKMPDMYRGEFQNRDTAGLHYARDVKRAIDQIKSKGRNVAAFIAESILSCGGQIVLPDHYLKESYRLIRAEGGLCIADEVQVGFGRVGDHFWAFELQGVVPDIITCGKPIGNGHPLAAVITTRKVAEAFANGMEYFNTFGGNPVSCAIGIEVLDVLRDENLQDNAKEVGSFLLDGLNDLKEKYVIIGDIRGIGLFLGFELVKDRHTLEPAADQATYLVNRMRELGILLSTDGPLHNVIKIKPPMCITKDTAAEVLKRLDEVFAEDFMLVSV